MSFHHLLLFECRQIKLSGQIEQSLSQFTGNEWDMEKRRENSDREQREPWNGETVQ
jgi:hypothetical protein